MRTSALPTFLVLFGLAALGGCAAPAVVLKPDPVPFVAAGAGQPPAQAWSLWVAETRDVRPAGKSGPKVGTLYTRLRKTAQTAYLEPSPDLYVKAQLSRYLLSKGWEASGPGAARALLHVEVEDFGFREEPGSVWDQMAVRVIYTVRILTPSNQELGRVRLEGSSQFDSPLDTERQLEKAFASALSDTFEAFSRSEVLRTALGQL